jgi:ubiquinone/menaquinone biosynthesis C-methylase UbiE
MKRVATPELLDDDLGTPAEVAVSLNDLRHINQWFGGTRTTITLLRQIARQSKAEELSLLEIGAGAGDVPRFAKRALAQRGVTLNVTLLDRSLSHLPRGGTSSVVSDAMRMPFPDNSFDVVGSSLFAHHFDPEALKSLIAESLRVCRRAVIINDLIRSRLHLLLVFLGMPLFRSRITWHDAPASVRAAYSVGEMRSVLAKLGMSRVEVSRHFLYRMGIIIWK